MHQVFALFCIIFYHLLCLLFYPNTLSILTHSHFILDFIAVVHRRNKAPKIAQDILHLAMPNHFSLPLQVPKVIQLS